MTRARQKCVFYLMPYATMFESSDISDTVFVRHLGKSTVDAKPLFDGFYALRQT